MYKVETICVGINHLRAPHFNGMECEIIGDLKDRWAVSYDTHEPGGGMTYIVEWANGEVTYTFHSQLRPKHYPGSWEDELFQEVLKELGWNPFKEKENVV